MVNIDNNYFLVLDENVIAPFLSNIYGLYVPYYRDYKSAHSNLASEFLTVVQGDQIVSVHLFLYYNHQVHRDFLITLYVGLMAPRMWHNVLVHEYQCSEEACSLQLQHNVLSHTRPL